MVEVKRILTKEAPAAIGPYVQATAAGGLVFASGQIALDPATGQMVGDGDVRAETRQVMKNLTAVLQAAGTNWDHVLKTTIYLVDIGDFPAVNEVYAETVGEAVPARATVQVAALPRGARVEIEAVAAVM